MRTVLTACLLLIACTSVALAQASRPIYDSRLNLEPTQPTAAEANLLNRTAKQKARQIWSDVRGCKESFQVEDAATGSFTSVQAQQRVFLYTYCITGHNFTKGGVVIVEDGELVGHVVYSGGGKHAVGALPDLNENGFNEVIIAGSAYNMGTTSGGVSIIELGPAGVRSLGYVGTYKNHCGIEDAGFGDAPDPPKEAFVLYATEAAQPQFFRQRYVSKSCDTTNWRQQGDLKALKLGQQSTSYTRVQ